MTTGENLIIHPEPAATPVTVDQLLEDTAEKQEVRPDEMEMPSSYLVQNESEPEMPDSSADDESGDQEELRDET